MGKKQRPTTSQEKMVASFAEHSISSRNTFHPNQWKKSGREPADMLIVVGKAVLFVNMTAGKSYFHDLVDHNIDQARDRMAEWAAGLSIKGANQWRKFDVSWNAVEYIAIISVVDGPHSGCAYHEITKLNLDPKVRLCATVTAEVMFSLSSRGGGARDLLTFCQSMRGVDRLLAPESILLLQRQYDSAITRREANVRRIPKSIGPFILHDKEISVFKYFMNLFVSMRRQGAINAEAFSDLDWNDVAEAAAFLTSSTAEMESLSRGQIRAAQYGHSTRFTLIISTNAASLVEHFPKILQQAKVDGAQFVLTVGLTAIGLIPTIAFIEGSAAKATELLLATC